MIGINNFFIDLNELNKRSVFFKIMETMESMNKNKLDKNKYPHIALSPDTYLRLKNRGRMGDTFEKLVCDLLSQQQQKEGFS